MISSAMTIKFLMWLKHSSSFRWNTSLVMVMPNGITVNLNLPILVLKVMRYDDVSSRVWCQYPFLQLHTVRMQAPAKWWAMSSGIQKWYGSLIMALFTGSRTPACSIWSISFWNALFRWIGTSLYGGCFGVTVGSMLMWYDGPRNLPMPLKTSGYCCQICS